MNFAVDNNTVVFRTGPGTKQWAMEDDAVVAIEADSVSAEFGISWSVVVKGTVENAGSEGPRLDEIRHALFPWQGVGQDHLFRIVPASVTGRRFDLSSPISLGTPLNDATRAGLELVRCVLRNQVAPPRTGTVLSADRLVKRFGDLTAVDDVSFAIRPGETYGLLGPNGAGKTTFINMVAGLVPADSGSVEVARIRWTRQALRQNVIWGWYLKSIGTGAGLVLAGSGGWMVPPEFFAEPLQSFSLLTPHRWAYDVLAAIQRRDAAFTDILPCLGVLTAMAAFLPLCGAWLLRRNFQRAL